MGFACLVYLDITIPDKINLTDELLPIKIKYTIGQFNIVDR